MPAATLVFGRELAPVAEQASQIFLSFFGTVNGDVLEFIRRWFTVIFARHYLIFPCIGRQNPDVIALVIVTLCR